MKKSKKQKATEAMQQVVEAVKQVVEPAPVVHVYRVCQDCGGELANPRWRVCEPCLTKRHQAREERGKQAKTA